MKMTYHAKEGERPWGATRFRRAQPCRSSNGGGSSMRVGPKLVVLGLVACFGLLEAAWAQLPPLPPLPPLPGLFDPLGGPTGPSSTNPAVSTVMSSSMNRLPAGQPPYGVDAAGNPVWPLPEPAPTPPSAGGGPPSLATFRAPRAEDIGPVTGTVDRLHDLPATTRYLPATARTLVASGFSEGIGGPAGVGSGDPLTDAEVKRLRLVFLLDLQRHAKYIYQGRNDLALQVALKWQAFGKLHPAQIDEVTLEIARKKGAGSFATWIDGVVGIDWQYVRGP